MMLSIFGIVKVETVFLQSTVGFTRYTYAVAVQSTKQNYKYTHRLSRTNSIRMFSAFRPTFTCKEVINVVIFAAILNRLL